MPAPCRDGLTQPEGGKRCPSCRSPRVITHPELYVPGIAHMDCDAFCAAVKKRDNPALAERPVMRMHNEGAG